MAVTYFPAERFPGLAELYRELRSITAVMAKFGLSDYRRATTQITAGLPNEDDAACLRQSRRDPALIVESVDVDADDTPISFSEVVFAGGRVQLVVGQTDAR